LDANAVTSKLSANKKDRSGRYIPPTFNDDAILSKKLTFILWFDNYPEESDNLSYVIIESAVSEKDLFKPQKN
jgi:hypothetical protein